MYFGQFNSHFWNFFVLSVKSFSHIFDSILTFFGRFQKGFKTVEYYFLQFFWSFCEAFEEICISRRYVGKFLCHVTAKLSVLEHKNPQIFLRRNWKCHFFPQTFILLARRSCRRRIIWHHIGGKLPANWLLIYYNETTTSIHRAAHQTLAAM